MKPRRGQSPVRKRRILTSTFALVQSVVLILSLMATFAMSSVAHAADVTSITKEEQPEADTEENRTLELIGAKKMLLKVGEEFVDPGAVLLDENGNLQYMLFVYSDEVTVLDVEGQRHPELEVYCSVYGKVATETEGEYLRKIMYKNKSAERLVTVMENPEEGLYKPEGDVELFYSLKLKGDSESIVKYGTQFEDPGVEVYDQFWIRHEELEKDVKAIGEINTKQVKYYLWRYDLNGETINRIFRVVRQKEPLALRLINASKITILAGETFEDEGAMVYTKGGIRRKDLDDQIVMRGTVNTLKPGEYILIYDLDGVTVTQTVLVEVKSKTTTTNTNDTYNPDFNDNSQGIYTPNDGPGYNPTIPAPPTPPTPEEPDDPPPPGEEDTNFGGGSDTGEDPPPSGEEKDGFGGN